MTPCKAVDSRPPVRSVSSKGGHSSVPGSLAGINHIRAMKREMLVGSGNHLRMDGWRARIEAGRDRRRGSTSDDQSLSIM